jgi:hypothetical protein
MIELFAGERPFNYLVLTGVFVVLGFLVTVLLLCWSGRPKYLLKVVPSLIGFVALGFAIAYYVEFGLQEFADEMTAGILDLLDVNGTTYGTEESRVNWYERNVLHGRTFRLSWEKIVRDTERFVKERTTNTALALMIVVPLWLAAHIAHSCLFPDERDILD